MGVTKKDRGEWVCGDAVILDALTIGGDVALTGAIVIGGDFTIGEDGDGSDLTLYGAVASYKVFWDQDGDTNGALYFGANTYGILTQWYGDTTGYYVKWDPSGNTNGAWYFGANTKGVMVNLYAITTGGGVFWDPAGDSNAGELALGATGGAKGVDLKAYGNTTGNYLLWDQSGNDLLLVGTGTQLAVAGDTDSSSTTTGSLRTAGGLGVVKTLYVGTGADITGNLAVDGTTVVLDGATSVRGISAGFTSFESPANRFGVNSTIYMQVATTASSGITAITHTGTGPTVTWTADSFDFVGPITLDAVTTSGKMAFGGVTDWGTGATGVLVDGAGYDWASQTIARVNSDINNTAAAAAYHALTVTVSQANSNSFFGTWTELYFSNSVDLTGADNNAAVWGQLEAGTNVTFFDTGCFTAAMYANVKAGATMVIGTGHTVNGVRAQAEISAVTNNGRLAAFECLKSGGVDWEYGLYIADTTTDIYLSNGALIHNTSAALLSITEAEVSISAKLSVGVNAAAGTIEIYPGTTNKGTTTLTMTDNSGDTITNVNVAAQAGARTYTIPDAGASASFVMTASAQDIGGVKTFTSNPIISAATGSLDFSGGTSATISTSTAGIGITLDAADAAAGTQISYVTIAGVTPAHTSATPTDIFLDINPTIGIPTVDTNTHAIDIAMTSPAYATGAATGNCRAIYIQATIGNASAGTNAYNVIEIGTISGDAEVTTRGLYIGAMSGTGATENAIQVDAGWDAGLQSASPVLIIGGALSVGADATAGTLTLYPTSTGKGITTLTMTDNSGATTTNINVAAQAGARTYTIPDGGASASFLMTQGTQTIVGGCFFTATLSVGANASAGTLELYPTTTNQGTTTLTMADNTGDTITNVNTAAQAGARTYTIPDAGASANFVMMTSSQAVAGTLTRADLTEEALAVYGIPLALVRQEDGIALAVGETADTFNLIVSGDIWYLKSEISQGETETSESCLQFILPPEYVSTGDVKVRIKNRCVLGSGTNNGSTLDVEVFEQDGNGAIGADLVSTSAQTYAASSAWQTTDFVVDGSGLAVGEILNVVITASVIESGASNPIHVELDGLAMLLDIKG